MPELWKDRKETHVREMLRKRGKRKLNRNWMEQNKIP